jgi:hypothetical protein
MPDTQKHTTSDDDTDNALLRVLMEGVVQELISIRDDAEATDRSRARAAILLIKYATPFPPKVTTEADAIPGEDDLRSRWVTVAAVDDD